MAGSNLLNLIDALAGAVRLPLSPEHRPGVANFFALASSMAAIVEAVPLAPHDESALRFEPVEPAKKGGA